MTSVDPGWPKLGLAGPTLIVSWPVFWAGTMARFAIFVEDPSEQNNQ